MALEEQSKNNREVLWRRWGRSTGVAGVSCTWKSPLTGGEEGCGENRGTGTDGGMTGGDRGRARGEK